MTAAFRRALAATVIVIATIALVPRAGNALVARPCATSADHVAVVVDTGSGVSAACVPLKSGDDGLSLLVRRASMLGKPAPRINGDGFLCAIDGVPDTGCGEDAGAKAYWSYWHGDGGWSYESLGGGSTRPDPNTVEGWRFEPTSGAKEAPRGAASATTTCPPPAPPPPAATPPPVQSLGSARAPVAHPGASTVQPPAGSTTAPARGRAAVSPTSTSRPKTSSTPSSAFLGNDPVVARHSSGGGAHVGLFAGLALVAVLAAAGVFVARTRRRATQ